MRDKSPKQTFTVLTPHTDGGDLSLYDIRLESEDWHESTLNGLTLKSVVAKNCNFSSVEFAEANFSDSEFKNVNFNSSDLVSFEAENCLFTNCSFENGEIREAIFKKCKFENCYFRSTTICLSKFNRCNIDKETFQSLQGITTQYNLFVENEIDFQTIKIEQLVLFVSQNFGLQKSQAQERMKINKELFASQFSIDFFNLNFRDENAVKALALSYQRIIDDSKRKNLIKARYMGLICEVLLKEKFISIASSYYLFKEIVRLAGHTTCSELALEMLSTSFRLKLKLMEHFEKIEQVIYEAQFAKYGSAKVELFLERSFTMNQTQLLVDKIAELGEIPHNMLKLTKYKTGSTYADIVINMGYLGTFIYSLSLLLRRVKILLDDTSNLLDSVEKLMSRRIKKTTNGVSILQGNIDPKKQEVLNKLEKFYLENGNEVLSFSGDGKVRVRVGSEKS